MTELQFLIDLLLNHKLSKETKALIKERIGQVEAQYARPQQVIQRPIVRSPTAQAASTQAILEKNPDLIKNPQEIVSNPTHIVEETPLRPITPADLAINRIAGAEVSTGKGMKGPRKF